MSEQEKSFTEIAIDTFEPVYNQYVEKGFIPPVAGKLALVDVAKAVAAHVRAESAEDLRLLRSDRNRLIEEGIAANARSAALEHLLRVCLGDYGHPNFTDRHGMADRIRAALKGGSK